MSETRDYADDPWERSYRLLVKTQDKAYRRLVMLQLSMAGNLVLAFLAAVYYSQCQ